jgi:hypothetical protein
MDRGILENEGKLAETTRSTEKEFGSGDRI